MAPYNTQYERLAVHLSAAGVAAEPNLWDCPVTLAREHRRATPDSDATTATGAPQTPVARLGTWSSVGYRRVVARQAHCSRLCSADSEAVRCAMLGCLMSCGVVYGEYNVKGCFVLSLMVNTLTSGCWCWQGVACQCGSRRRCCRQTGCCPSWCPSMAGRARSAAAQPAAARHGALLAMSRRGLCSVQGFAVPDGFFPWRAGRTLRQRGQRRRGTVRT